MEYKNFLEQLESFLELEPSAIYGKLNWSRQRYAYAKKNNAVPFENIILIGRMFCLTPNELGRFLYNCEDIKRKRIC